MSEPEAWALTDSLTEVMTAPARAVEMALIKWTQSVERRLAALEALAQSPSTGTPEEKWNGAIHLSEAAADRIALHIAHCEDCRNKLNAHLIAQAQSRSAG